MINLDDLEAKARRAIEARGLNVGMADVRMSHAALNLVSTCSPESVLALVAELRALRAVADAARIVDDGASFGPNGVVAGHTDMSRLSDALAALEAP